MNNFAIISDSSCDLNKELRERFGIAECALGYVNKTDGTSQRANLDWTEEECNAFFTELTKKNDKYKTSTPSIVEVMEVMEVHLKQGRDVLAVTLSTGLSGMYGVFVNAGRELSEKYPDRKVICVDSLRYSTSEALVCVLASQYREMGKSIEETAALLEKNRHKVRQMGWLDDLFYCKKMGRVSNAAAIMGTLVGIKPMADFNKEGKSHVIGKTRGYKNAYRIIVEYIKRTGENLQDQVIFIAQTLRLKEAKELERLIKEEINPKEIIITSVGHGSAANIGPGLVAAFYIGAEASEDMSVETKLFAEISASLK